MQLSLYKFFKTAIWTRPTSSCNFVVFEKFTRTCLHLISLEVILLPLRMYIYYYQSTIVNIILVLYGLL